MAYTYGDYITYVLLSSGRAANFRDEEAIHNSDFISKLQETNTVEALCDIFYPVGSCFETRDTSFDPSVSWGGTWNLIEVVRIQNIPYNRWVRIN